MSGGWLFAQPSTSFLDDVYNNSILLEKRVVENPRLYFNDPDAGKLQSIWQGSKRLQSHTKSGNKQEVINEVRKLHKISRTIYRSTIPEKGKINISYRYYSI